MPRKAMMRTPEEEEKYRIRRRERNTQIQRDRRRKLKEMTLFNNQKKNLEEGKFEEILDYIKNFGTSPTMVEKESSISESKKLPENDEMMKVLRRQKNTEAQRKRRAQLKQMKFQTQRKMIENQLEKPRRTPEEEDAYVLLRRKRNTESQRRRRQKLREEKLRATSMISDNSRLNDDQMAPEECTKVIMEMLKICAANLTSNSYSNPTD